MSKIKIETMGCYQQVVDVIGVENAKVELFKAMESYVTPEDEQTFKVTAKLVDCFDWDSTIQGNDFWFYIHVREYPYGK